MSSSTDSSRQTTTSPGSDHPIKHTSFSTIDGFYNCERQVYYDKIEKVPRQPSTMLSIGHIYHGALEALCRHQLAGGEFCEDVIKQALKLGLSDAKAKKEWKKPRMLERLLGYAEENLAWACSVLIPNLRLESAESWYRDARFVAKLDVLSANTPYDLDNSYVFQDHPCVLDWKVVMNESRRTTRSVKEGGQIAKYCWLKGVRHGAIVELHKRGPKQHHPQIFTVEFTEEEIAKWARWYDEGDKALRARPLEEHAWKLAHPSAPLCSKKWCQFWDRCPGGGAYNE